MIYLLKMDATDHQLLELYHRCGDQAAFRELLRRHFNLVHATALRHVHSAQLAEEVAQSVFIQLARQARFLAAGTILPAWLWRVSRRMAINVARRESRRRLREHAAYELAAMNAPGPDWARIEPLLDEALQALPETDRAVVILRWFEGKSLREIAAALRTGEDAAQKRGSRALDRLREFLARRNVTTSSRALAGALCANGAPPTPAALSATLASRVLVSGTTTKLGWFAALLASILALAKPAKFAATTVLIAVVAILAWRALPAAPRPAGPDSIASPKSAALLKVPVRTLKEAPTTPAVGNVADILQPPLSCSACHSRPTRSTEAVVKILQPPPSPFGTLSGAIKVKLGDLETTNHLTIGDGVTTRFALDGGIDATALVMKAPKSAMMFYDFDLQGIASDGKATQAGSMLTGVFGQPVASEGAASDRLSFTFTPD